VFNQKGDAMRKILVAVATVATLAFSAAAPAHAQRGVGAAIAGGLIGGAIVGGAIASSPYYYGPGPYYGPRPYPYYYGGGPAYVAEDPDGCYWQRQRFWDGYAWRFRRVRVCG
jgi:streptogramin lyase